jgi:formylglycine-generating enzyme required for sulfatase activity
MPAADTKPNARSRFFFATGLGLAAALLIGSVLTKDRPDPDLAPVMAEQPVQIAGQSLQVMKYEVTIAEWDRCYQDGGCALELRARPDQNPAETPATGLSYIDVRDYITWINAKTEGGFRLPTVAEWEHIAAPVLPEEPDPIFTDPELTWASSYLLEEQKSRTLRQSGYFSTTAEGISDLDGSVWEWTMDCYAGSGVADPNRCPAFFVAGEHIAAMSYLVRDPARGGCAVGTPPAHLGMRLVRNAT